MSALPFAVDTSVVVAALLTWHEHHEPSLSLLEALWAERPLVLPLPALVESYAVMTRLPPPHRLSPPDAYTLLHESFSADSALAHLEGADAWSLLDRLAGKGIAGGRTYDAHILTAAQRAGAELLITLNPKDFDALPGRELALRSPLHAQASPTLNAPR